MNWKILFTVLFLLLFSCGVPRICETEVWHTDSLITPGLHSFAYKSTQYIPGTEGTGWHRVGTIYVTISSDTFSLDTTFSWLSSDRWYGDAEGGEDRVTSPKIFVPCSSVVTITTEACGTLDLN